MAAMAVDASWMPYPPEVDGSRDVLGGFEEH